MIDKIAVSQDRKSGTVYFIEGKAFHFYHSNGKVVELISEVIELRPTPIFIEKTEKIEIQMSLFKDAA